MAVKSHICLLGLIILCSLLTGMSEAEVTVFSSFGENVTLACINALSDCTSTTWTYTKHCSSVTVELIAGGIKNKNIERAERLSLGSDCSLNIYKTTEEDHGQYTCSQYVNGQKHGTDAQAFLHVLHVSPSSTQIEMRSGSSVTLTCQLFTYDCDSLIRTEDLQLFWVNQDGVNLLTDSRYQILSSGPCIITLTTTLLNEVNNTELRCLVKKRYEIKTSASYTVKFRGMSEAEVTVFSSLGANVTLACINALSDCTSTTWTYTKHRSSVTVELINGGIKNKNIERAERLSLGSDCSLNIYKTTKDDHGQYTCLQYVNEQKLGTDAQAFLHVLQVSSSSAQTEIRSGSSVTLTCQFFTFDNTCDSLVRYENLQLFWVNQADVNLLTDSRYQILSSGPCIITLTTTLLNEDNNTELRCLVKMKNEIKTSVSYTVKLEDSAVTNTNFERSTSNVSETERS